MTLFRRILSPLMGVLSLGLVILCGLIPFVWLSQWTAPQVHLILSGADPIITAYLEMAAVTVPLLIGAAILFALAAVAFFRGRPAFRHVGLAELLILVSLRVADGFGLTRLDIAPSGAVALAAAMALFLATTAIVSRPGEVS